MRPRGTVRSNKRSVAINVLIAPLHRMFFTNPFVFDNQSSPQNRGRKCLKMQYVDRKHLLQIPALWAEGATDTVSEASMAEIALSTVSFFNKTCFSPCTMLDDQLRGCCILSKYYLLTTYIDCLSSPSEKLIMLFLLFFQPQTFTGIRRTLEIGSPRLLGP